MPLPQPFRKYRVRPVDAFSTLGLSLPRGPTLGRDSWQERRLRLLATIAIVSLIVIDVGAIVLIAATYRVGAETTANRLVLGVLKTQLIVERLALIAVQVVAARMVVWFEEGVSAKPVWEWSSVMSAALAILDSIHVLAVAAIRPPDFVTILGLMTALAVANLPIFVFKNWEVRKVLAEIDGVRLLPPIVITTVSDAPAATTTTNVVIAQTSDSSAC